MTPENFLKKSLNRLFIDPGVLKDTKQTTQHAKPGIITIGQYKAIINGFLSSLLSLSTSFFRLWVKELVVFELRFEFCTSKTSPGTISHAWKPEISANISVAVLIIIIPEKTQVFYYTQSTV